MGNRQGHGGRGAGACRIIWWGSLRRKKAFSVADYVEAAGRCIVEIAGRGRLPFVVGGTGLYMRAC